MRSEELGLKSGAFFVPQRQHLFLFMLISFLWTSALSATTLTLTVIDQHNRPIPLVVVQSEGQTVFSDNEGLVRINISAPPVEAGGGRGGASDSNITFTFSRLGFHRLTKTTEELLKSQTVRMQTLSIEVDEVVVTGERIHSPFRTTSPTRRIEVSDLGKVYASVDDLLRDIGEIDVRGVQLSGERQTVSLGGHQSRHTVIMLDNIVLNPAGQAVDLSSIPAAQIETVEIIKNNTSVESGSGGIAGMIVLHSKRGQRINEIYVSESVGSYGSVKHSGGFRWHHRNLMLAMTGAHQYADNDFEYTYRGEKLKRKYNSKKISNLGGEIVYQTERQYIAYNLRCQKFSKQLPGSVNYSQLFQKAYQEGSSSHHNLQYLGKFILFNEPLHIDTKAYHIENQSFYNNTQAPLWFYYAKDKTVQTMTGVKAGIQFTTPVKARFQFAPPAQAGKGRGGATYSITDFKVNLGTEYKAETFAVDDQLTGRNDVPKVEAETGSLFGGLKLKGESEGGLFETELAFNARLDIALPLGTFDTALTEGRGRVGSKQHHTYRGEFNLKLYTSIPLLVKSSLGTSYMVPSFYELYWKGDSQTSGNPSLKPEESFGYRVELATDSNPTLSIAKWQNLTNNMIYWNRTHQGWKPFNLSTAEIDNWELLGTYHFLKNQSFSINYIRTTALDKTSRGAFYDKHIIYTPTYQFNATLNLKVKALSQSFTYSATGKQYITQDNAIPPLKGYEVWNSVSGADFKVGIFNFTLNGSVYNIFDRRYEIYDYMPEVGRNWEVGVKLGVKS